MPYVIAGFNCLDGTFPGFVGTVGFKRDFNEADFALAVVSAHKPEAVGVLDAATT
jgi:hypothetical protein